MTEQEFLEKMAQRGFTKTGHNEYSSDMDNKMHTHDFPFEALVLEGQFMLTTEEGSITVGPGDTWSLDAGVLHAEKVVGTMPVKFVFGLP